MVGNTHQREVQLIGQLQHSGRYLMKIPFHFNNKAAGAAVGQVPQHLLLLYRIVQQKVARSQHDLSGTHPIDHLRVIEHHCAGYGARQAVRTGGHLHHPQLILFQKLPQRHKCASLRQNTNPPPILMIPLYPISVNRLLCRRTKNRARICAVRRAWPRKSCYPIGENTSDRKRGST